MNDPLSPPIYVGLLHHSILNKSGQVINTAITNLDIHDISRACRTYGVSGYFLLNPDREQQNIAKRIIDHWQSSAGKSYNQDRAEALSRVQIHSWLQEAMDQIEEKWGCAPFLVMTSARTVEKIKIMRYRELQVRLQQSSQPIVLVFGTGWGIESDLLRKADAVLPPLRPERETEYLHLSVRSAVAITLDRLLGEQAGEQVGERENRE